MPLTLQQMSKLGTAGVIDHITDGTMGMISVMHAIAGKFTGKPSDFTKFLMQLNALDKTGSDLWVYFVANGFPNKPRDAGGEPDLDHFIRVVDQEGTPALQRLANEFMAQM